MVRSMESCWARRKPSFLNGLCYCSVSRSDIRSGLVAHRLLTAIIPVSSREWGIVGFEGRRKLWFSAAHTYIVHRDHDGAEGAVRGNSNGAMATYTSVFS